MQQQVTEPSRVSRANKIDFHYFAKAVRDQFEEMSQHELYIVDADKDLIWDTYLDSFPEGTNELFRERTEHDCSCCKHFIRNLGAVVSIVNGELQTVWDGSSVGFPYDDVSEAMSDYIKSRPIKRLFRVSEPQFGAEMTPEIKPDGTTHRWNHFVGRPVAQHILSGAAIGPFLSKTDSAYQVLQRGLSELKAEAFDTVSDLLDQGSLYRGDEFKAAIAEFRQLQQKFMSYPKKDLFVWQHINSPAARFRNTVIGTLLQDLSEGRDLESAVKAYETKVAPANYQRPTALITKGMIDKAMVTLDELGLREAVERRHAKVSDISVNDVLFVDSSVESKMKDSLAESLMQEAVSQPAKVENATAIPIQEFIDNVLPKCSGLDVLLESKHLGNFASITAPMAETENQLFSWPNNFGWSYDGDVTDSIKEKVKRAGGNVDAAMRVSLAWYNYDDLDIHVIEPGGNHVYHANRCGKLDVDMNVGSRGSREPVENVSWTDRNLRDGVYQVFVHNYAKRESIDVGFEIEFAMGEQAANYRYEKAVRDKAKVQCLELTLTNGEATIRKLDKDLVEGQNSREKWNLSTGQLVPVDTITISPNHWNGKSHGNKHWFFILRGCLNPEPVRCIYNEFLHKSLKEHRKVFEVLGSKTKAPYSDEQLSGLGFSSTKRDSLTVVTRGQSSRAYSLQF